METATITQGVVGFAIYRDRDGGCQPYPTEFDFVPVRAFDAAAEEVFATWTAIESGSLRPTRFPLGPYRPTYQLGLPEGSYAAFWDAGHRVEAIVFRLRPTRIMGVHAFTWPEFVGGVFRLQIDGPDFLENSRRFLIDDGAAKSWPW